MWVARPFLEALSKRKREEGLLDQLEECIERLYYNPRLPGLNYEKLRTTGKYSLHSARLGRGPRLLFARISASEIALLHFDRHDEAYDWADRHARTIQTMLGRERELRAGDSVRALLGSPPPVRPDVDSPVAVTSLEEFRKLLEVGPELYLAHLTREQRQLVDLRLEGALLVKGGAGTGKTAVAVHRTLALARQPGLTGSNRVLYLCYNNNLAHAVRQLLAALSGGSLPPEVEANTFHSWSIQFLRERGVTLSAVDQDACKQMVYRAYGELSVDEKSVLSQRDGTFIDDEIEHVIKPNCISTLDEYLRLERRGLGGMLKVERREREIIWRVYEQAERYRKAKGICRHADLLAVALEESRDLPEDARYRAVVLDEAQDCSVAMIRLARQLLPSTSNQIAVFADPAQTIYRTGFQWAQDELKRAHPTVRWLRKPYRNTREIYDLARPLIEGDQELRTLFHEDLRNQGLPERRGEPPRFVIAAREEEVLSGLVELLRRDLTQRPAA